MKKVKNILFFVLMIGIILLAGFYRDLVFKSVNALLQAWDYDMDYVMPAGLRFFEQYEYNTVVNLKWLLTLIFSVAYLIITLIVIYYLFKNKRFMQITITSYTGIILISAVFIGIGLLFKGSSEKMYEFARYFMGMAQSPIILMVLIPAFKLLGKENTGAAK